MVILWEKLNMGLTSQYQPTQPAGLLYAYIMGKYILVTNPITTHDGGKLEGERVNVNNYPAQR